MVPMFLEPCLRAPPVADEAKLAIGITIFQFFSLLPSSVPVGNSVDTGLLLVHPAYLA